MFNVGSGIPVDFVALARMITRIAKSGAFEFTDFTKERKEIEPGDYYTDITKIKKIVGWRPKVGLAQGITMTIAYYRKHKEKYW